MSRRRVKSLGWGGITYESNRTEADDSAYVFDFGKYKGMRLLEVAAKYPKYIVWAVEQTDYIFCSQALYERCRVVVDKDYEVKQQKVIEKRCREYAKQCREYTQWRQDHPWPTV